MESIQKSDARDGLVHPRTIKLRYHVRYGEVAVSSQVGSILLVVLTVVLASVIALFMTGLVEFSEPPPTLNYICSHVPGRWNIHIISVSESVSISEFRLVAAHENGTYVKYDTNADLITDRRLVTGLDSLVVLSASWPMFSPLVFVDHDANGKITAGDFLTVFGLYFPSVAPFLDATRGYQEVEPAPGGIPRGSQLLIVASPTTLTLGTIDPGDVVRVTLDKGGPFEVTKEGIASSCGYFVALVNVNETWVPASYMQTTFVIRPGEVDEWTQIIPFKVRMEEPISPEDRERYDAVTRPMGYGDVIVIVHVESNTIVLKFKL